MLASSGQVDLYTLQKLLTRKSPTMTQRYQVLEEFYVTVTAQLSPGLDKELACRDVRSLRAWQPIAADYRVLEGAWLLQDRYRFPWWDALIVAAAQLSECQYLLTEDFQEGLDLGGNLKVIHPVHQRPEDLTW